jgi:hypothetical protein
MHCAPIQRAKSAPQGRLQLRRQEDDSAAIGKIQKNAAEIVANASQPTAERVAR